MIQARRNGNGLDIFDEVLDDPFFGEKENKIMNMPGLVRKYCPFKSGIN